MQQLSAFLGGRAARLRRAAPAATVRLADRAARWAFERARAEVERRLGAALGVRDAGDGRVAVVPPPGLDARAVLDAVLEEMRAALAADAAPLRPNGGRWGSVGAGVLPLSTATGRVLLGRRSGSVEEPWTWGTWGGAVAGVPSRYASDPAARRSAAGVDLGAAALREFREESGWEGVAAELVPLLVYRERGFRYHNFLLVLGDEFEPRLDWEHDDAAWWDLDELPEDLHFGLEALLADPASARAIAARRGAQ